MGERQSPGILPTSGKLYIVVIISTRLIEDSRLFAFKNAR